MARSKPRPMHRFEFEVLSPGTDRVQRFPTLIFFSKPPTTADWAYVEQKHPTLTFNKTPYDPDALVYGVRRKDPMPTKPMPAKPTKTTIAIPTMLRSTAKYLRGLEQKALTEALDQMKQGKTATLSGLLEALADVEEAGC